MGSAQGIESKAINHFYSICPASGTLIAMILLKRSLHNDGIHGSHNLLK
jgi:hypothetical protein